jgi:N-acetylglucosamine-6-phosphate deacetylase
MDIWIAPDQIFDGHTVHSGMAVRLINGRVSDLVATPNGAKRIPGMLSPGFVDLQVNGGGGVMLNTTPTPIGIETIAKSHRRFGTVAVLPTVITDHADVLDRAADAAIVANGNGGILGMHIEGPHISLARRGTHKAKFVRPMDARTLATVARLRQAHVRVLITVAPEATTPVQVQELVQMGAVVSLGHTDVDANQMQAAFAAGASCATHLFNAMSPMLGRAPGAVGAVINSDCYSGIICDGHHVADDMVGMAIRARPIPDRMFLVSDAMATVGGPDHFELYGQTVTLQDGQLVNQEGSLAGAHVTQAEGVRRLVQRVGTSLETALRMATSTPAACIGLPLMGTLQNRSLEDLILLDNALMVQTDLATVLSNALVVNAAS